MPVSKYAAKSMTAVVRDPARSPRRCCDKCGRPLSGSRGHGWPTVNGRTIQCDYCTFPASAPKRGRLEIPEPDYERDYTRAREFTRA